MTCSGEAQAAERDRGPILAAQGARGWGTPRRTRRARRARRGRGSPPLPANAQEIADSLIAWINTPTWDESRAYLEAHPELLDPATDAVLAAILQAYASDDGAVRTLQQQAALLQACREGASRRRMHGGGAVRAARVAQAAAGPSKVRLDWSLLLKDILWWEHPDAFVQLEWASAYYRGKPKPHTSPMDTTPSDSEALPVETGELL